jgi:Domain of unknown function (DUF4168)
MNFRTPLLIATIAAASWSIAPSAYSQEEELPPSATTDDEMPPADSAPPADPGTPVQETVPGASAQIDDQKIEQFADAYVAVQTIQQKAASELQNASDPAQADKLKSTAENQMIAAVERSGLQVDEFNQIVETMASNSDVRQRVAAKIQERGTPSPN